MFLFCLFLFCLFLCGVLFVAFFFFFFFFFFFLGGGGGEGIVFCCVFVFSNAAYLQTDFQLEENY